VIDRALNRVSETGRVSNVNHIVVIRVAG
jgi:hypothetical protein